MTRQLEPRWPTSEWCVNRQGSTEFCLSPLLPERLQIRSPEIFRSHGDPKLHIGIECEKPRFGKRRDIRRAHLDRQPVIARDMKDQAPLSPPSLAGPRFLVAVDYLAVLRPRRLRRRKEPPKAPNRVPSSEKLPGSGTAAAGMKISPFNFSSNKSQGPNCPAQRPGWPS